VTRRDSSAYKADKRVKLMKPLRDRAATVFRRKREAYEINCGGSTAEIAMVRIPNIA
jgi:aromatic ring hydroxylase